MCASRFAIALVAIGLAVACDSAPEGPAPELRADITALRRALNTDPARRPIADAERVADDQPVLASRLVETGAIPAARRQLEAVRGAAVGTSKGRRWRGRLERAYELRVEGLEQWRVFLANEGRDDERLLEATTTLRRAEVDLVRVDHEMERVLPTERPRPASADTSEGEASEAEE
jgi:hypothetical protein